MKKAFILIVTIFAVVFNGSAKADCLVSPRSFTANERLSYQLYYNLGFIWIKAGSCEFSVRPTIRNNKSTLQLRAVGQTDASFEAFFHVRDTFITYVDSATLIPSKSYKFTHEDKWHGIDLFTFSPNGEGFNITTQLKRKGAWQIPVESVTTTCGFDIITSVYRLRCFTDPGLFKKGHTMEIPVRLDDGEYRIFLTYLGKERVKLHSDGFYSAHTYRMTLVEGTIFKRGDALKVWISDDGNYIPIMVESPIRVGKVKAIFREGYDTRYPLVKSGER